MNLFSSGFLQRPKHVGLYGIKYSPTIFHDKNPLENINCSKTVHFEQPQKISCFGNAPAFEWIFVMKYRRRVFYSIKANVFGTQEKTGTKKIHPAKRKKLKMFENRRLKSIIFWCKIPSSAQKLENGGHDFGDFTEIFVRNRYHRPWVVSQNNYSFGGSVRRHKYRFWCRKSFHSVFELEFWCFSLDLSPACATPRSAPMTV